MNSIKTLGRPSKSGLSLKQLGESNYKRQYRAYKTGTHLEDLQPKPGEITLKEWLFNMAQRFQVTPSAVSMMISRHKIAPPPMRRVNKRVIFVIQKRQPSIGTPLAH